MPLVLHAFRANRLRPILIVPCLDIPAIEPGNALPPAFIQNPTTPNLNNDILTPSRKRPNRIPGFLGTSASFLVPDFIRKKFIDGWNVHVPLTYLTDRGCLLKDKSLANSAQDLLTIDGSSGRVLTTAKPLSDDGELNLTFDEWHQAWRRLLDLIKSYLPADLDAWTTHFSFILNNDNRAEQWPLYLAYDAEIRKGPHIFQ
jgi:hypothetical protein